MTSQTLPSRRLFLAAGAATAGCSALNAAAAAEVGALQDDAEIFRLAAALTIAYEHERAVSDEAFGDEEYSAAADATGEIVDQIVVTPARTLAGVRAKAEALNWCHGGKFKGIYGTDPGKMLVPTWPPTTDMRLVDSILFDLLAIAGPVVVTSRIVAAEEDAGK